MDMLISKHREGFKPGYTPVTTAGEAGDFTGITFGVLRLRAGESHVATLTDETAFLLMEGRVAGQVGGVSFELSRGSLFDESPACLHAAAGTPVRSGRIRTRSSRCTPARTRRLSFRACSARATSPTSAAAKARWGRCLRLVRTIFDARNSQPEVRLVLGEVVTLPGGWSSYPPHHHPQPEIYHYRFTHPQGFGHAEHGEDVFKVRQFDTVTIRAGNDHAQVAAPGTASYYAWVIRHLPGQPYDVPEFTAEHAWTMQPGAKIWEPPPVGGKAPAKHK